MTGKLIEALCRADCEQTTDNPDKLDTHGEPEWKSRQVRVHNYLQITSDAGYAIVPVNPPEEFMHDSIIVGGHYQSLIKKLQEEGE